MKDLEQKSIDVKTTTTEREIRLGRGNGKSVEIIHGIKEGERLITNPNFKIKEGLKVEPVMNSSN